MVDQTPDRSGSAPGDSRPLASLTAAVPGSRLRSLCVLAVALSPGVVMGLSMTVVIPLLPAIATHFGGDANAQLIAQYVMAMPGVGVTIGAPIAGIGVDRLGYRSVLVAALLIYVAAGLSGIFLESAPALLTARFLVGFGGGAAMAAATALIGEYWQGTQRAKLFGYVASSGAALAFPSVIVSGAIGQAFGWHAPFLLYGIALPLALCSLAVPAKKREAQTAEPRAQTKSTWSDWRPLMPIFLGGLALYIVFFAPMTQLPLILPDVGIADHTERSLILALPTVFASVSAFLYGYLHRSVGRHRMTFLLILFYGIGITAMGSINGAAIAILSVVLCGTGMGLMPPHFAYEVTTEAAAHIRGRASAIITAIHYFAQFLNSLIIGTLGAHIGLRPALLVTGVLFLVWLAAAMPKAITAKPRPAF